MSSLISRRVGSVARSTYSSSSSTSRNEDVDDDQLEHENNSPSLIDLVFSWTLEDVLNEHLYNHKVQKIPKTFSSVEQYLNSYRYPLVEETHADLLSNMKSVSRWTPSCKILSVEEDKSYYPPKDLNYKMRLCSKKDSKNQEIYKPQLNDVIALSDVRPMSVNDLNRPRRSYFPAVVTGICVDGDSNVFQVLASRPIEFEQSEEEKESLFAMFLINMTTNVRIWRALSGGNASIIEEVLHADSLVGFSCDHCSQKVDYLLGTNLRDRLNSFNLNESQVNAVLGSFATSKCNHKNSVKLIWGPPGTGKTKTVGTLLWTLLMKKCKTLTCTPTNIAVVQVTSRLMSLVKQTLKHEGYGLGDIVLFGNEERMKIDDHKDLHDVFLNYRVDKLVECFSPLSGWSHQLHSMIWLLEDADQQYLSYVEKLKLQKQQTVAQNKNIDGLKNTQCEEVLGFRDFFINHFCRIEHGIISCIRCCCTHLATSFMSVSVVDKMNMVLSLLATLRTSLHDTRLIDGELQKIFSKPRSENNTVSYSSAFLLSERRNQCLEILKSLDEEFDSPNFSEVNVKDFCLQNACLIFCTASSSANLSALKTLELLIIDEAAQLKECESTIPLQLPGVRHAILVGDERQLPAMVMSKISEKSEFGRSLFERLVLLGHPKHLLNVQYRMHPSISLFPNAKFYNKQISDAPNVQDRSYRCDLLDGKMYGPYSFIDVSYGKEESGNGRSQRNIFEVAVVSEIVENLCIASVAKRQKVTVGVISPYKAQVFALTEKLGKKYETYKDFSVSVRSVDGFQGGEEDVIIYSAVRSNQNGNVGFLSNHQRTNVALTRARYCLWILGSGATLINSDSVWKELVLDAKDRECYFSVDDDKRLAKAIIDCIIELAQLEGVLTMNSPLFKGSRWKVIFEDCFCESMVRIKSLETQKEVVALMVKLLNGWRHNQTQKDMFWLKDGNSSQVLEQYKIDGLLHLLWTVDIRKANTKCIQVLKFWDILPSYQIPELAEHVDGIFAKYSPNNRNRCNFKCHEGILEVPMSWEVGMDSEGLKDINEINSGALANQLASLSLGKERKFSISCKEAENYCRQKMADHLGGIFGNYTFNNINRCKVKCHEGILEIPMSWEIGKDDAGLKDINEINYGDLTNQLATLNLGKEFKFRGQSSRTKNRRQFKKNSSFPRKL